MVRIILLISLAVASVWGDKKKIEFDDGDCKEIKITHATMSSEWDDKMGPEMALDEDPDTFCHSKLEKNPWFMAVFKESKVGDVIIYNSQHSCCAEQLDKATVTIADSAGTQHKCGVIQTERVEDNMDQVYTVNCHGHRGSSMKLEVPGERFLHVLEVKVFKKCAADEKSKKEGGGKCGAALTWCDGACKHVHMCSGH